MNGPIVNGERFAPGYTREAAEYEQATRRTNLSLPITVPQAIRLHGYLTEKIARDGRKLETLAVLRGAFSTDPNEVEDILSATITDDRRLLDALGGLLYG